MNAEEVPGGVPSTLSAGWASGFYITRTLAPAPGLPPPRCVNDDAVWVLSSAKPGNGIPQLLNDNLEEYWQSDGTAPHIISIQFRRRTALSELAFYVDHGADESYTPKSVSLRAGSLHHDLEELRRFELPGAPPGVTGAPLGPVGWVRVPLGDPAGKGVNRFLRTWYLQLMVTGMHANGRDLHIRCVKALGPGAPPRAAAAGGAAPNEDAEDEFGGLDALAGLVVR